MVAVFAAKRKASTNYVTMNDHSFCRHIDLAGLFTDSAIGLIDRRSLSIVCIHCSE